MKGVDVLRDQYGNRIGEIQIDGSNLDVSYAIGAERCTRLLSVI